MPPDTGFALPLSTHPIRHNKSMTRELTVVEICAGAGGQSLGLELAGFAHSLAVELDANAAATLRHNRPAWKVAQGDVASLDVWDPVAYRGVDLLAGGVPCPPFTIAGRQLGATDERDLFAWAIELCGVVRPRALMLENVRGLSLPRFSAYRQHVLDRLTELGYTASWKLLHAADYGVPQLRPRFVLVAMRPDDFARFSWPAPQGLPFTVGQTLYELMGARGWPGARAWARRAMDIAPTIVGGSKKHGGADLGPTRAKRAWREMGVDALGIADLAPDADAPVDLLPKLTCEMVARLQGWSGADYRWEFTGRKTAVYRQIGNAFPPPLARAIGERIAAALSGSTVADPTEERGQAPHDLVYAVLRNDGGFVTRDEITRRTGMTSGELDRRLDHLRRDFHIERIADSYKLGAFKAFTGQEDHLRHEAFNPSRIS
jgi:DNA (cytosine-5)-methyltransferase 1